MENKVIFTDEGALDYDHKFDDDIQQLASQICTEVDKIAKLEKRDAQREKLSFIVLQTSLILDGQFNDEGLQDMSQLLADHVQALMNDEAEIACQLLDDQEKGAGLIKKLQLKHGIKKQNKILNEVRKMAQYVNDFCDSVCGVSEQV